MTIIVYQYQLLITKTFVNNQYRELVTRRAGGFHEKILDTGLGAELSVPDPRCPTCRRDN